MLKKSRIFLLIILVTSVFSVTLSSNFLKYTPNTEVSPDKTIELFDLKSSGPQINITTPENKTYLEPMSGYYPATCGFENDEVDSVPFGWTDESVGPTWVKVIASEDGHNNVLQLYDTAGGDPYAINAIGNKEYGTVEFWMKNVDMTEKAYFAPRNGATHLFRVLLADNMVIVTAQGGTGYDLAAATADTWHHFSVDFECGTGGYKGLGQYEFSVTYNGMRYGPYNFWNNAPYANNTAFSGYYGSGNHYYVDAVGYSWDPDYSIGDNMYEGLLLSINTGFTPDWLGYSLDSQTNKTILKNSTIKMPSNGLHSVQVFGNDSLGYDYQSDVRYFTILIEPPPTYPGEEESNIILIIIISVSVGVGVMGLVTVGVIYKRKHVPSRDTKPTEPKRVRPQKKRPKEQISDSGIPINCPFCQAELPGDQKYCFYCGANLKE